MNKGSLFVISGPSGTGKGTICEKLLEADSLFLSVSATTRDKRNNEIEGVTYNYVTTEEFKRMINEGEMLEWAKYSGNYYGTPKKNVEDMLKEGKNVVLEIEPQGALKVKQMIPEAVLIFVIPPSMTELKQRLIGRGRETDDQIKERIENSFWEISQAEKYNEIVVNDDLDECVKKIQRIIEKRNEGTKRIENLLNEKI